MNHFHDLLQKPSWTLLVGPQVLSSGLVVTAGKGKAYIEAAQMADCWSLPHDYEPGTELTASVLYVLPQTDFQTQYKPTYLTLKNVTDFLVPNINIGETFQAVVSHFNFLILCVAYYFIPYFNF